MSSTRASSRRSSTSLIKSKSNFSVKSNQRNSKKSVAMSHRVHSSRKTHQIDRDRGQTDPVTATDLEVDRKLTVFYLLVKANCTRHQLCKTVCLSVADGNFPRRFSWTSFSAKRPDGQSLLRDLEIQDLFLFCTFL